MKKYESNLESFQEDKEKIGEDLGKEESKVKTTPNKEISCQEPLVTDEKSNK